MAKIADAQASTDTNTQQLTDVSQNTAQDYSLRSLEDLNLPPREEQNQPAHSDNILLSAPKTAENNVETAGKTQEPLTTDKQIELHKKRAEAFVEVLKRYSGSGYSVQLDRSGTIVKIDRELEKEKGTSILINDRLRLRQKGFQADVYSLGKNPLEHILLAYGKMWEVNPQLSELKQKGKLKEFPQFELNITKTREGKVVLQLWDYLDPQNPLAMEWVFENKKEFELFKEGHSAANEIIFDIMKERIERGRSFLKKLAPHNSNKSYTIADFNPSTTLSNPQKEALKQFYQINILVAPHT
ncbi:MAG: hypothetical protein D6780_02135, partial [Candidatus Dadabacteria bacterium]